MAVSTLQAIVEKPPLLHQQPDCKLIDVIENDPQKRFLVQDQLTGSTVGLAEYLKNSGALQRFWNDVALMISEQGSAVSILRIEREVHFPSDERRPMRCVLEEDPNRRFVLVKCRNGFPMVDLAPSVIRYSNGSDATSSSSSSSSVKEEQLRDSVEFQPTKKRKYIREENNYFHNLNKNRPHSISSGDMLDPVLAAKRLRDFILEKPGRKWISSKHNGELKQFRVYYPEYFEHSGVINRAGGLVTFLHVKAHRKYVYLKKPLGNNNNELPRICAVDH